MTIAITDSPFGHQRTMGKPALVISQQSFAAALSSSRSRAEARSQRALGFQEAGLLGVYRTFPETAFRDQSDGSSSQTGARSENTQPPLRILNEHSMETHHSATPSTVARSGQDVRSVPSKIKPAISTSPTLGSNVTRLSTVDATSPEVCRANGNSVLYPTAVKRRRRETLFMNDDKHAISILIGSPSLKEDKLKKLNQSLTILLHQYGMTLKNITINGISGHDIKCTMDSGD